MSRGSCLTVSDPRDRLEATAEESDFVDLSIDESSFHFAGAADDRLRSVLDDTGLAYAFILVGIGRLDAGLTA